MAQQHAASRSNLKNVRSNAMPLTEVQGLVDTGAARAFESLSELMERRPIRIPQLVETIESTLMIVDVSWIIYHFIRSLYLRLLL